MLIDANIVYFFKVHMFDQGTFPKNHLYNTVFQIEKQKTLAPKTSGLQGF
jgi:hypothetical protein